MKKLPMTWYHIHMKNGQELQTTNRDKVLSSIETGRISIPEMCRNGRMRMVSRKITYIERQDTISTGDYVVKTIYQV